MLDARATTLLSRFLHKLISTSLSGPAAGGPGAPAAGEPAEVALAAAQCLEGLTLLVNPDVTLSPGAGREQRVQVRDMDAAVSGTAARDGRCGVS